MKIVNTFFRGFGNWSISYNGALLKFSLFSFLAPKNGWILYFGHYWNSYYFGIFWGQSAESSNWTWLKSNLSLSTFFFDRTMNSIWIWLEFMCHENILVHSKQKIERPGILWVDSYVTILSASSRWHEWPHETNWTHPTQSFDRRSGTTRCQSCRRTAYTRSVHVHREVSFEPSRRLHLKDRNVLTSDYQGVVHTLKI